MKKFIAFLLTVIFVLELCPVTATAQSLSTKSGGMDDALALESLPDRLLYAKGEELELEGLKVTLNGKDVTKDISVSGYDSTTTGSQTVELLYDGNAAAFDVDVFGFTGASLTLEGKVSLNFYADFPSEVSAYEPGVLFFREQPADEQIRSALQAGKMLRGEKQSDGSCRFTYDDIAAKEMSDLIYAVPVAKLSGGDYVTGSASSLSAAEYVSLAFDSYDDAALRTMLVDMLNYGAAAQDYFDYRTDAPANAGLDADQQALATQDTPAADSYAALYADDLSSSALPLQGVSLTLENETSINLYTAPESGVRAVQLLLFDTYEEGGLYDRTAAASIVTAARSGASLVGSITNIPAKHMRRPCYARLQAETADGQTIYSDIVRYSIESYVHTILNGSYDDKLRSLADRMLRYGDSAAVYFGDQGHNETHVITFEANAEGVENMPAAKEVASGDYASAPALPQKADHLFLGWYENASETDYSNWFDFENTPINSSITLYAGWVNITDDTDGDGLPDSVEAKLGTDPLKTDTDGDGLTDYIEVGTLGTVPLKADTDDDGVGDMDEDNDEDGISNRQELADGTNLILSDTDMDGLSDQQEKTMGTDPTKADTDEDGANDGLEAALETDPLRADASFTDTYQAQPVGEGFPVSASVTAQVDGSNMGSVVINPVRYVDNQFISQTIPGYMGYAFEFCVNDSIQAATLEFEYDTALGTVGDDFQPRIYFFNEETQGLEELPDQRVENGKVLIGTEHFSTYIMLNKVEYDKANQERAELYVGTDVTDKNEDALPDLYAEMIMDGRIAMATGSLMLVGIDFNADADYDNDGLLNGEEIEVRKGEYGLYVYMNSNPMLSDSDFDGIDDADELAVQTEADTYALKTYANAQNYSAAMNISFPADEVDFLLSDRDFAHMKVQEDIQGSWFHSIFTAVGTMDYGTITDICVHEWMEYLAVYSENALQSYEKVCTLQIAAEDFMEGMDALSNVYGMIMTSGEALEVGAYTLSLIIEEKNAFVEGFETAKKAYMLTNDSARFTEDVAKLRAVELKYNKTVEFKRSLTTVSGKTDDLVNAMDNHKFSKAASIIPYVVMTASEINKMVQINKFYASANANFEAYQGTKEMFESVVRKAAIEADMGALPMKHVQKAASEVLEYLNSESKEEAFKKLEEFRERELEITARRLIKDLAVELICDVFTEGYPMLNLAITGLRYAIDRGKEVTYRRNVAVINAYLASATATLVLNDYVEKDYMTDTYHCLVQGNEAWMMFYLAHLAQIRLVAEKKFYDLSQSFDEFDASVKRILKHSETLGIVYTADFMMKVDEWLNTPNVVIQVRNFPKQHFDPVDPGAGDVAPENSIGYIRTGAEIYINGKQYSGTTNVAGLRNLYLTPNKHYSIYAAYTETTTGVRRMTLPWDVVPRSSGSQYIEMYLRDVYTFTGTVVDNNGDCVVGATVQVLQKGCLYYELLTDKHGQFTCLLPAADFEFVISADGYTDVYEAYTMPSVAVYKTFSLKKDSLGYEVFGTIVDAETGKPIQRFDVEIMIYDESGLVGSTTTALMDGKFLAVLNIEAPGSISYIVETAGYKLKHVENVFVEEGRNDLGTIELEKMESIKVTHVMTDGTVENILGMKYVEVCNTVGVTNWSVSWPEDWSVLTISKSDADWFTITETNNTDTSKNLRIDVTAATLLPAGRTGTITFIGGRTGELIKTTVTLMQKAYRVKGIVVDENDAPLAGASVKVWNNVGFSHTVVTGADGVFDVPVADAWYEVTVTAEGYPEKTVTLQSPVEGKNVDAGRIMMSADLPLTLTGKIVDATVGGVNYGFPIEGINVSVYDADGNYVGWGYSDADGVFTLTFPKPGTYRVTYDDYSNQAYKSVEMDNVIIVANTPSMGVITMTEPEWFTITGKVVNDTDGSMDEGRGVMNAEVSTYAKAPGQSYSMTYSAYTRGDGSFTLKVPVEGEYELDVKKTGFDPKYSVKTTLTGKTVDVGTIMMTEADELLFGGFMVDYYNGHSYVTIPIEDYIYTGSMNGVDANIWEKAQEFCEQMGGHLVTITSEEENDFLFKTGYLIYPLSGDIAEKSLIGYTDSQTEGTWKWATGETSTYANWGDNEPRNDINDRDYAYIYMDRYPYMSTKVFGKWYTAQPTYYDNYDEEDYQYVDHFICEWDYIIDDVEDFVIDSGELSENISWIYRADGVLEVSGEGEIPDYGYYSPWGAEWGSVWYDRAIRKVIVGDGITRIGDYAFYDMMPHIWSYDRFGNRQGYELRLPEGLESIGNRAFGLSNLGYMLLPESVNAIGYGAFYGTLLREVYIPKGVSCMGTEELTYTLFDTCDMLECIEVAEDNPYFCDVDGVLYSKDMKGLITYPMGRKQKRFEIPEGVEGIVYDAFGYGSEYRHVPIRILILPESWDPDWYEGKIYNNVSLEDLYSLTDVYFYGDSPRYGRIYDLNTSVTLHYIEGKAGWTTPTWTDANGNVFNTEPFVP